MNNLRQQAKRWLPIPLQEKWRMIEAAYQQRLYCPSHLKVWRNDFHGKLSEDSRDEQLRAIYVQDLLNWLKRAQDAVPGGGVAGYYSFAEGWSAAYPETTGYIITTCLDAAVRLHDDELAERARRMADWEVSIQMPEGSWQSGFVTAPLIPAVFNTGQVIQGLVAAYGTFRQESYLEAAIRGGDWLIDNQDDDGAWRRNTYNNFPNSYSTRVAWPLLSLADASGDVRFRHCAIRYLQWAARCQTENGWLKQCTLEVNEPALTHTLAYTLEGFLESGILLKDEQWVKIAQKTADILLHRYELRRHLAGTYDQDWHGDPTFACLTGCAQTSRVWGRLFELTHDARYLNAALKLNDFVLASVDLQSSNPGIRGGVKGSQPIWGAYMKWRLPSWAAKFTLDAIFQEQNALSRLEEDNSEHCDSLQPSPQPLRSRSAASA